MTRIARNLLFLLSCTCISITQAQIGTPCDSSGYAGLFPCNGFDLLSNIDKSILSNEDGSDIWGWTDSTTGKEYALITFEDKTCFVDVTDPVNPLYVGQLPTNASTFNVWRDVKVYNDHAYIVADNVGSHGMQVFDLTRLRNVTNPPETFTTDTVLNDVGSCHNIAINEDTGFAYLIGCKTFSGGPHFVNLSNPVNPVSAGGYSTDGYTHDAQVVIYDGPDNEHDGKEIMIASNENEIVILDVTNKSNVIRLGRVDYPNVGYTHQGWLSEDHRYFFLGDETDEINFGLNTRGLVFDFANLDNPAYMTNFSGTSNAIDHNYYVKGNRLYQANYTAGLRILDISNPSNITEIGYFDTYPSNNGTSFNGAWSVYPYFNSGNIIISDINRGLFVIRESSTLNTENTANVDFRMYPNPTSDHTVIKAGKNMPLNKIEVFDVLGKSISAYTNIETIQFQLPVTQLPKGMYIVKINDNQSKKLIVD